MTKKFGMILALVGATAFFGANSAYSSPAEPTNLMDYLKAKRAAAEKDKEGGKSAKTAQTASKGKKSVVKTHASKRPWRHPSVRLSKPRSGSEPRCATGISPMSTR